MPGDVLDVLASFATETVLDMADELRLAKAQLIARELSVRPAQTLSSVGYDIGSLEAVRDASETLRAALTAVPNHTEAPGGPGDGRPFCSVCGESGVSLVNEYEDMGDECLVCVAEDACEARREERFPPQLPPWTARQNAALDRVTSAGAVADAIMALAACGRTALDDSVLRLSAEEIGQSGPATRRVLRHELAHAIAARRLGGTVTEIALAAGGGRTRWSGLEPVAGMAALLAGFIADRRLLGLDAALSSSWADFGELLAALPEDGDAAAEMVTSALELAEKTLEGVDLTELVPDDGPLALSRPQAAPRKRRTARPLAPAPVLIPPVVGDTLRDSRLRTHLLGHPANRLALLGHR